MTREAHLPDGTVLEFPDSTPDAVMDKVVKSHLSGSTPHDNGLVGTAAGAGDALLHHLVSAPLGIAQLAGKGVAGAVRGFAPGYAAKLDAQSEGLKPYEQDYQNRVTGNAGSWAGAAVGEVAPWMTGMGEARALGLLPELAKTRDVAGLIPKAVNVAKKTGLLAGEGGLMGAATPVTGDGSYADQKAQQVGVGMAAAPLLHAPFSSYPAHGASQAFNRLFRPEAAADRIVADSVDPAALAGLRQGSAAGVVPTVAEAAPSPRAVKLERKLRNDPLGGIAFANQDVANNAARRSLIEKLAGTPEDMAAAKKARFDATDPYYQQLPGQRVDPASVLQAIDGLHNSSLGVRPNIKSAAASLKAEITSRTGPDGMIGTDILSGLHENAGSHLGPMASAQEKRALAPIKNTIADALDAAVPGYRANLAAYGTHSQPITTMESLRRILGEIDSGGRDAGGGQVATLNVLRKALKSDDKARFPMSPEARKQLEAIHDSLQARSAVNNTLGASGSNTAADRLLAGKHMGLAKAGAAMAAGGLLGHLTGIPGLGETVGGGVGLIAKGLLSHSNDKVRLLVADRMANAEKAAAAIEALKQKKRGLLGNMPDYLLPYSAPQLAN